MSGAVRYAGLVVLIAAALLVALLSFDTVRDRNACASNAHGLQHRYSYLGGCDYRVGDEWVSDRLLRFTPDGTILRQVSTVSARGAMSPLLDRDQETTG